MKKLTLILISITLLTAACKTDNSQTENTNEDSRKIYKSEKIGFFTDKMQLTEKEAIRFWPIYNAYENQRDSVWKRRKHFLINYKRNNETINDSALNIFLSYDQQLHNINKETVEKLRSFLSDDKILLMFYTEQQFKHFVVNRIRGRHNSTNRSGRGQGRGRSMLGEPQPPCAHISSFE